MRTFCAVLVALILAYAGAGKMVDPDGFALAIGNYRLLPKALWTPTAYFLAPLELVTALALLVPSYRRTGWLLAGALFSLFATAVGSALVRGLDISCGCLGQAMTVSWWHLGANVLLGAVCLGSAFTLPGALSQEKAQTPAASIH